MAEQPVRINTRISSRANEWLDERSRKTSLSKSALVNIAIENYIKEIDVVEGLPSIVNMFRFLDNIKRDLEEISSDSATITVSRKDLEQLVNAYEKSSNAFN